MPKGDFEGEFEDVTIGGVNGVLASQSAAAGDSILITDAGKVFLGRTPQATPVENVRMDGELSVVEADLGAGGFEHKAVQFSAITDGLTTTNSNILTGVRGNANIDGTSSATFNNSVRGLQGTSTHAGTGLVNNLEGSNGAAISDGSGDINSMMGARGWLIFGGSSGSNTVVNASSVRGTTTLLGSSDITNLASIHASNVVTPGNTYSGTITNQYGLRVDNVDKGQNNYAIYTNEGDIRFGDSTYIENDGVLAIGTSTPMASIHTTGSIIAEHTSTPSDRRFKEDFQPITGALDKVNQVRGLYYTYKQDAFPEMGFSDAQQVEVIAQELEEGLARGSTHPRQWLQDRGLCQDHATAPRSHQRATSAKYRPFK